MNRVIESWFAKVAGALFATIVAPVIVAVGLKYADSVLPPADAGACSAQSNAHDDPTRPAQGAAVTSIATSAVAKPLPVPGPIRPKSENASPASLRLFNGCDLTGFSTWLGPEKKGGKPIGINRDPQHVFSVTKNGLLRISGQTDGLLFTRQTYHDYLLTIEYRWGDETSPPRQARARSSGLLLHLSGKVVDPSSRTAIMCQIKEGVTGDFVLYGKQRLGGPSLSVEVDRRQAVRGKQPMTLLSYRPGAPLTTISTGFVARAHRDEQWRDVKGFRGRDELERPAGQWNTLECVCEGDKITTRLNGEIVNVATAVRPQRGRIALQSTGAEIFFRRVDLTPIAK
jgi:hypothetical protein